ncbi:2-oxoglutarate dehydrogenase E1 component [Azospirillum picis]|uniref:2-oxoglutarate dehydrogenase E1 component n=1 Tax=Azospirillum picis TaxID=488438 RepID=A0ABU0MP76_9PROT|nr:2-oxoglutarate dehydrogenase E1 component [Azospirillum picis]MBP2301431.1 2-oxoglutarate dehydrogenase E1 component [Azospirillum picis]MDQ0535262.1 2-oxoglutarate dehydrogenase E1 component [Azospirillum picis]
MSANLEQTSFLFGSNAGYVAELYARFLSDPAAVDQSWSGFFQDLDDDSRAVLDELRGASWTVTDLEDPKAKRDPVAESFVVNGAAPAGSPNGANGAAAMLEGPGNGAMLSHAQQVYGGISHQQLRAATLDSIRALMLIRVFRVRGHMNAHFDPLGLEKREPHPELDPATYGFGPGDLDRPIFLNYSLGLESATLRQILDILHKTYCGTIGVEFMHIQDPEEKAWIQERIEGGRNHTDFTVNGKRAILERLTAAEGFEKFLQLKYTGTKRFGLEGGESMIPALEQILKRGGQLGLREVVVGMAHRGRLNVLTNFMGKPFSAVFSEFQGNPSSPEDVQGSGDVKYHLGTSSDRDFNGNILHLSLTANPSHLEWVNPVVLGKVRAKQQQRRDLEREQVMGILIHGDAAFAGQGIVAETLGLSELRGYRTGGTMHFIINNQIGFTTNPTYSRSGVYCSDMAKMVQAPIFHVNGDDPESVVHVSRIAIEYRQKFKRDVVVDMVCYRRHGHNEGDEPGFTQPIMYKKIRAHATTRELYAKQLVDENVITQAEGDQIAQDFMKKLEGEFEASSTYKPNKADWLEGKWAGLQAQSASSPHRGETGVELARLKEIGLKLCEYPKDFAINSKIARQLEAKKKTLETGEGIDWATAEALAYGTLVAEGTGVRLSGQDSGRGTFSHRHAVMYDQNTEEKYVPLCHVSPNQATFEVHDSPLSEAAVVGYEYGYSLAEPHNLVLWEAQFGDFANTAQTIIDQFISSGESKWLRLSGLVMLLPHGYEGQGPEHSSARPERFLQMCAEDNWQICNVTTPANLFHVFRRQIHRSFRKPLVLLTPKSLLRHKLCISDLSEMGPGTSFHRVLGETANDLAANDKIRRIVVCSGKVYYDLLQERMSRGIKDVVILRLEQLYPFPKDTLAAEFAKYPNAELVWCQEEPENQGAWHFADRRLEAVLKDIGHKAGRPSYVGRPPAASPATGLLKRHNQEQAKLLDGALTVR